MDTPAPAATAAANKSLDREVGHFGLQSAKFGLLDSNFGFGLYDANFKLQLVVFGNS